MATLRSLVPLAQLIEARDSLETAYRESMKTIVSQYSFQERQVLYEQRSAIRLEINALNRKIGLADPDINATGVNKSDLFNFRYNDARG